MFIFVCLFVCLFVCRYYFRGDRAGTVEVFVDNLPGWPDNIHHSSRGGYWLGNAIIRSSITNHLSSTLVSLRSLIAKVTGDCVHWALGGGGDFPKGWDSPPPPLYETYCPLIAVLCIIIP